MEIKITGELVLCGKDGPKNYHLTDGACTDKTIHCFLLSFCGSRIA